MRWQRSLDTRRWRRCFHNRGLRLGRRRRWRRSGFLLLFGGRLGFFFFLRCRLRHFFLLFGRKFLLRDGSFETLDLRDKLIQEAIGRHGFRTGRRSFGDQFEVKFGDGRFQCLLGRCGGCSGSRGLRYWRGRSRRRWRRRRWGSFRLGHGFGGDLFPFVGKVDFLIHHARRRRGKNWLSGPRRGRGRRRRWRQWFGFAWRHRDCKFGRRRSCSRWRNRFGTRLRRRRSGARRSNHRSRRYLFFGSSRRALETASKFREPFGIDRVAAAGINLLQFGGKLGRLAVVARAEGDIEEPFERWSVVGDTLQDGLEKLRSLLRQPIAGE